MTGYNPAQYYANTEAGIDGATIRCRDCCGPEAHIFQINASDTEAWIYNALPLIINATRQHHDDHHEGK